MISFNGDSVIQGSYTNSGTTITCFGIFVPQQSSYDNTRVVSFATAPGVLDYNNIGSLGAIVLDAGRTVYTQRNSTQLITTTTFTTNDLAMASLLYTGSTRQLFLNGGGQVSDSFSGSFGTTLYGIGAYAGFNPSSYAFNKYTGLVGEVIVYNSALSTTQRQQVEGYLARKWGVTQLSGHPYRFGGPGILPASIPGCSLWLDGADSTTLFQDTAGASPVTSNGQTVRRWNDKSGRGCNATQAGNAPVWNSSGYTTFAHTSAQNLRLPDGTLPTSAGTNAYSMFAVARPTVASRNLTILCSGSAGTGQFNALQIAGDGRIMNLWFNSDVGGGSVPLNTFSIMNANYTGATRTVFLTGSNVNTTNSTGWAGTISNNVIGMESATNNWAFTGDIAELIVYPTALSVTDRQRIEGYLANKWGINSRLPSPALTGPYAGSIIPVRSFSPLDVDGMTLWLDAADRDTLTLSGSNVTQWRDKTGLNTSSSIAGAPTVTTSALLNNQSVVRFNGSSDSLLYSSFSFSQPFTVFAVTVQRASTNSALSFVLNSSSGSSAVILYRDGPNLNFWAGGENVAASPTVAYTSNLPGVYSAVFNGASSFLGFNGQGTSNQNPGTAAWSTLYLGRDWSGIWQSHDVGEVLFYSSALSTTQRQQVETYLAGKWGLRGSMGGTPHPHRYAPAAVLPTQISGCALWLDAADATTLTLSGSNVTAWADKSGNGRNATGGVSPTFSNSGVVFNGTNMYLSTAYSAVPTAETFFCVATWTGTDTRNYCIIGTSATNGRNFNVLPNGGSVFIKWDRWGVGGYATAAGVQTGVRFLANGFFTGSNGQTTLNGGTTSPTESFSFSGSGTTNIGTGVLGDYYQGTINEIVAYTTVLTTTQRQQIEGYLAWKWGLQASLPGFTAPFANFKRALTPVFVPTQIEGCALWLDAADPATLTLSGSNVTAWADKSGNGNTATTATGTLTHSSNSIVFTGSQAMTTSLSSVMPTQTIFAVASADTTSYMDLLSVNAGTTVDNGLQVILSNNYRQFVTRMGGTSIATGGTVTQSTRFLYGLTYISGGNSFIYLNGSQTGSNTTSPAISGTGTVMVGAYRLNNITDEFYNGRINEVLIYNQVLSTSQRQRIEGYLAEKWGLRASLGGLNHPFIYGPPSVLPTQFTGCTLWLDATDSTSFTLSGSNVTQWRDKSSNAYAGTASGNPVRTTVDGYSAVTFDGTQYINFGDVADLGAAPLNIFVVSKFNTTGSGTLIGKTYYGEATSRYVLFRDNGVLIPLLHTSGGQNTPSVADTSTTRRVLSWTWDRTAQTIYQNGTSILSSTFSNTDTFNSTFSLLVGAYPSSGTGGPPPVSGLSLNGSINEIVCMFGTLTTSQRQQIEGYLAWKWGLQQSLASSAHPYKTFKP